MSACLQGSVTKKKSES